VIFMSLKTDNIKHIWQVAGDYFCLYHLRTSITPLDYYLEQFNIDDYWIYKRTSQQRLVNIEDILSFKWSSYTFFKKEKYNKDDINNWLDYYYEYIDEIKFLDKPLPPFPPKKIIIKK